jgi:hypothetical protein
MDVFLSALFGLIAALSAGGGVLVLLILGLTEVAKQFGAKDKVALGINVGIGLVMGSLIVIGSQGVPSTVQGWVVMVLFDLICSLVASGIYKIVPK